MTSPEDLLDALNCTIRFTTPEGDYEGVLKHIFAPSRMISVAKSLFLQSNTKLGTLNFMLHEVSNVKILNRPNSPSENVNETSLMYFRSDVEGLFNLDGDSESESEYKVDEISSEEKFVMKLLPCFLKWMSTDSQIIDSISNEFNLAIKLISGEDLIGVSLEGPKISRNGILTWLCISTPSCTYLFDILALGEKSFQNGLKSILENSKIKKIFHDCRLASDCLFHMYNVCLVNVFDTQVADSFVIMQESKNCCIVKQVNSLNTCLNFYLQIPDDYLYSPLVFSLDKKSIHYHGLRPLGHSFRGAMIKNVIYLRLLKRELETALMTPLRRATDIYLNVVQNATDRELMVAPPVLDELPPELLLEGIQMVRFQQHEFIPPIVSSGPPFRKLVNPIKDFVECCKKFHTKQENKCLPSVDTISQNGKTSEFSFRNISNETRKRSNQLSSDFSEGKCISCQKNAEKTFGVNKYNNTNYVRVPQSNDGEDIAINMERNIEDKKNCANSFIDPPAKVDNCKSKSHIAAATCITVHKASSNTKLLEKHANEVVKNSFIHQNFHLSENDCKVSNPVGNCLLRICNEMPHDKDLRSSKTSITSELFNGNSTGLFSGTLGKEKLNVQPLSEADWEALCNEIRKDCIAKQSGCDQNDHRHKLRFVPAGMALI